MRNAFLSTVPGRPPLCTPKTLARPPPTCPAWTRDWPSCSPKRGCRGVGLPVGTRRLPRLGGRDLLPGGSRWNAKVVKHEKSPSSGPMGHGKGRISQQRPQFLDYSENILFQALVKHSLDSRDAKKHQFTQFTHSVCSHETTLGRPRRRRGLRLGNHLKHCQTPSKIINGLNLLRASKSPAEHVGRLDMARLYNKKYSLHRFS